MLLEIGPDGNVPDSVWNGGRKDHTGVIEKQIGPLVRTHGKSRTSDAVKYST